MLITGILSMALGNILTVVAVGYRIAFIVIKMLVYGGRND